jgi:hypothetical protein
VGERPGQLQWLSPVLIVVGTLAVLVLLALPGPRVRAAAIGTTVAALLLAPSVWALDTLGYPTSGTFPAGGPASVETAGGAPFGGFPGRPPGARRLGAGRALLGPAAGAPGAGGEGGFGAPPGAAGAGAAPTLRGGLGGGAGGPFGGEGSLTEVLAYVKQHGGGTIAVSSQSSAAAAIISSGAQVAGIGGFSGRESDVSQSWLAQEVRAGRIRWVLDGQGVGGLTRSLPGEHRTGATTALAAVASACTRVTLATSKSGTTEALYDCRGRAAELASPAARESSS